MALTPDRPDNIFPGPEPVFQIRRALGPLALENKGGPSEKLMYGAKRPLKIQDTDWCTANQKYSRIDLISF